MSNIFDARALAEMQIETEDAGRKIISDFLQDFYGLRFVPPELRDLLILEEAPQPEGDFYG